MPYLAHSAHAQLGAISLGLVGWTLVGVSLGLVEWRVWIFPRSPSFSSGRAWIGIWRACFHTYEEATPGFWIMHCTPINFQDSFTPPEIASAQFLMFLALVVGLFGNTCGFYALRNATFGIKPLTRLAFHLGGVLTLIAAILALIPLLWNLVAILTNRTIAFPPEFELPELPEVQLVGGAVRAGLVGVALMIIKAIVFVLYKLPKEGMRNSNRAEGKDNPAFEFYDIQL